MAQHVRTKTRIGSGQVEDVRAGVYLSFAIDRFGPYEERAGDAKTEAQLTISRAMMMTGKL